MGKWLAFTLVLILFVLPIFEITPEEKDAVEASFVHHISDYHWQHTKIGIFPGMHWWSKWHWHFWEQSSIIWRSFHWANNKNYYWKHYGHPNSIFGWEFKPSAQWSFADDWNALHTYEGTVFWYLKMHPDPKWLGRECTVCPNH